MVIGLSMVILSLKVPSSLSITLYDNLAGRRALSIFHSTGPTLDLLRYEQVLKFAAWAALITVIEAIDTPIGIVMKFILATENVDGKGLFLLALSLITTCCSLHSTFDPHDALLSVLNFWDLEASLLLRFPRGSSWRHRCTRVGCLARLQPLLGITVSPLSCHELQVLWPWSHSGLGRLDYAFLYLLGCWTSWWSIIVCVTTLGSLHLRTLQSWVSSCSDWLQKHRIFDYGRSSFWDWSWYSLLRYLLASLPSKSCFLILITANRWRSG